jgi:hypothetical protein
MRQSPTYRLFAPRWVAVVIGAHALGLVGLTVACVVAIVTPQPGIWVFAILFGGYGLICWLNLFLTANELRLEDGVVRWRAPLRSGELPLQSIRSIRNVVPSWPWPVVRIGGPGGPSVFISGTSELRAFVDALLLERAGIEVDERSYRSWHHDRWRLLM